MKKLILKDFELTEISGVDRPAQPTATVSIMKKATTFQNAINDQTMNRVIWESMDPLHDVIYSVTGNDNLDTATKTQLITSSVNQFADKIKNDLGVSSESITKFITDLAKGNFNIEDENMPTEAEKHAAELAAINKKLDDAVALAEANAILAKLNDDEKAFMSGMDDDAKKAFTSMTEDERKNKMEMTKAADETITVNGSTVSKSAVGADVFMVLKAQQAQIAVQQEAVAKAEAQAQMATLTKRATDEFGHVVGKAEEIADVLKALDDATPEVKATAEAIFKSAEEMAVKAFGKQGHRVSDGEGKSAAEELDTLAKAHATATSTDYNTAYAAIIEKHTDLYERVLNEGN